MSGRQNSVVLITGATGGIGRMTCDYLQTKGFTIYGTSRNDQMEENILPYKILKLDVSDSDSVNKCIKSIVKETGKINVLVNNAAYSYCGSLIDISLEDMIRQYNVNVFGAMRMIQGVIPYMLEQGDGMIINIGSIGGRLPLPFQAAYSSSKAALMNITDSLKIELLKDGIKVCLIEPGDTRTNFHESRSYAENFDSDNIAKRTIDIMHTSERKGIHPLEVAKVIYKAITSRNPKQRYVVGSDASLLNFLNRFLPSALRRKIVMKLYKVPDNKLW